MAARGFRGPVNFLLKEAITVAVGAIAVIGGTYPMAKVLPDGVGNHFFAPTKFSVVAPAVKLSPVTDVSLVVAPFASPNATATSVLLEDVSKSLTLDNIAAGIWITDSVASITDTTTIEPEKENPLPDSSYFYFISNLALDIIQDAFSELIGHIILFVLVPLAFCGLRSLLPTFGQPNKERSALQADDQSETEIKLNEILGQLRELEPLFPAQLESNRTILQTLKTGLIDQFQIVINNSASAQQANHATLIGAFRETQNMVAGLITQLETSKSLATSPDFSVLATKFDGLKEAFDKKNKIVTSIVSNNISIGQAILPLQNKIDQVILEFNAIRHDQVQNVVTKKDMDAAYQKSNKDLNEAVDDLDHNSGTRHADIKAFINDFDSKIAAVSKDVKSNLAGLESKFMAHITEQVNKATENLKGHVDNKIKLLTQSDDRIQASISTCRKTMIDMNETISATLEKIELNSRFPSLLQNLEIATAADVKSIVDASSAAQEERFFRLEDLLANIAESKSLELNLLVAQDESNPQLAIAPPPADHQEWMALIKRPETPEKEPAESEHSWNSLFDSP